MKNTKIYCELVEELKSEAKKVGQNISWFRFAKKTKCGWWFLTNKEEQWKKIEHIAKKISKKYPLFTVGQIVDWSCDLVNK